MTEKRFNLRLGRFYDGDCVMGNLLNDKQVLQLLNTLHEENILLDKSKMEMANDLGKVIDENEQLKSETLAVIDRKIKNNNCNPPKDCYYKVNRALQDVRESLRDIIGEYSKR